MKYRTLCMPLATVGVALIVILGLGAEVVPAAGDLVEGFSRQRLARINTVMQEALDQNRLGSVVTMVMRHGKVVHTSAQGWLDREAKVPVKADSLFRIASMTKTPTSMAVMMLVEEGKLAVTDPVSKYIPVFKKTTVGIPPPAGSAPGTPFTVVPAKREITVHDLLTKTAGMGYAPAYMRSAYDPLNLHAFYFADKDEPMRAVVEKLAAVPFEAQPGAKYQNGYATDVLGVVIEAASGMSLDEFFRTRIFEPLKMKDTFFYVPQDKVSRLATVYVAQRDGTVRRADGEAGNGQGEYVTGPRKAFSAGGGLISTAQDYGRMVQLLLNGGELDGVRLLGPKTVQLMMRNHVGDMYENPGIGQLGFGYGFELTLDPGTAHHMGSPGDFGYRSAYFTRYWGDPVEGVYAIFLTQLANYGGASDLHAKFRSLVYQALVESDDPALARLKPARASGDSTSRN